MDKEIGRMQKRYYCRDIVLQESLEEDQKVVMIREYTTSEKFNGFTKNSVTVPVKKWNSFLELIKKYKPSKT